MKIAILCGGLSGERDVSLSSGTGIAKALREKGHEVVLMDLYFGWEGAYADPAELFSSDGGEAYRVREELPDIAAVKARRKQQNDALMGDNVVEICRAADMTFLALHGDDGENGKLQATLDLAGIPYTGSGYLGSALAMHKGLSKLLFQENGIPTPPFIKLKKGQTPYGEIGFPCVVKPCSGGSSVGTSIVHTPEAYGAALAEAFGYEDEVLVERYIKGRELTVGVMDGKAMPVIEIIPKQGFYDYKNKYQAGLTEELCPAPLSAEDTVRVQKLAEQAARALMIEVYCRADFILDETDGTIYCLEVNTLPGMTPTSLIPQMAAAQGMDFGALCEEIIRISMEKYRV